MSTYYSNRQLMSYDRNKFPFRFIIGARGIGKTYSMQNLTCNLYHDVKLDNYDPNNVDDLFLWIRLTNRSIENMKGKVLDSKLQDKHNIVPAMESNRIYYNGRHMGDIVALADAPVIKGGVWNWQRYKYVIIDEFQREKRERRTFDVVYNLRSILESITRFTTRLKEGYDLPYVIFMGNTVDEATDLLYAFDFLPMKHGMYKLRSKNAIIEYSPNGAKYDELQRRNPLRVLSSGDDFTFGERQLRNRINVMDYRMIGHRRYIAHLHITDYITFEVWQAQKGFIYISKGLQINKYNNTHYVLHKYASNKGTMYSIEFHKLIRKNYENNNIYFDKRITGMIFMQNIV